MCTTTVVCPLKEKGGGGCCEQANDIQAQY